MTGTRGTRKAIPVQQVQALLIQLTLSLEKEQWPLVAATLTRSFKQRMAEFDN
ncbi:hypothetical protein OAM69_07355 [bacterium]|nr:hypothetical protein [bacterium]